MTENTLPTLWPDDQLPESSGVACNAEGPDTELAVMLLASGCTQAFIRQRCRFESARAVSAFCRDDEVRRAVLAASSERAQTIGNRAMVRLQRILSEEHTDLRATVLAVRTGLEVGGMLKRDAMAPVKTVRELTVPELNQLISATRAELEERIASGGTLANSTLPHSE